jgi:hypothetical protein
VQASARSGISLRWGELFSGSRRALCGEFECALSRPEHMNVVAARILPATGRPSSTRARQEHNLLPEMGHAVDERLKGWRGPLPQARPPLRPERVYDRDSPEPRAARWIHQPRPGGCERARQYSDGRRPAGAAPDLRSHSLRARPQLRPGALRRRGAQTAAR